MLIYQRVLIVGGTIQNSQNTLELMIHKMVSPPIKTAVWGLLIQGLTLNMMIDLLF